MKHAIAVVMLVAGIVGCSSDSPVTPTGPTPPASPPTGPGPVQGGGLRGAVADSAHRLLPGARIEVTSGAHAGQSTIADLSGAYSLGGPFDEGTTFRATKDGYVAAVGTLRVNVNCPTCSRWFHFFVLDLPSPPVNLAGDYRFTLVADSACELPAEVKTRSYSAAIRPADRTDGSASTSFNVTFPETSFVDDLSSFQIHVAADYASFNLEESHGPWLVERIRPTSYVGIGGMASASVRTPMSRLATPFEGTIQYCESAVPMAGYFACSSPVTHKSCASKNHQLILERR